MDALNELLNEIDYNISNDELSDLVAFYELIKKTNINENNYYELLKDYYFANTVDRLLALIKLIDYINQLANNDLNKKKAKHV